MSVWLTESEFRQSGAASVGITINAAFLQEIKDDNVEFRALVTDTCCNMAQGELEATDVARWLGDLRDSLETYFALEEFYGYFSQAQVINPAVSHQASELRGEHNTLFTTLLSLIDLTEQIVYHENRDPEALKKIVSGFEHFVEQLAEHEEREMNLMMRLCNEDIGVGD